MIIIPDVHGRNFWKDAVKGHESEEIIFLGDYVDPYSSFENVAPRDGMRSLKEVLAFKKQHADNVTLLLGNHDLSYVSSYLPECRHDYENHDEIRKLISDNLSLFEIAHESHIGSHSLIFSHAGILSDWIEQNEDVMGGVTPGHEVEELNNLFQSEKLYPALGDISEYRGGCQETGSCVWADINEHFNNMQKSSNRFCSDSYQIFGHTLQWHEEPIVTDSFACLDCRHAFHLDDDGNLTQVN